MKLKIAVAFGGRSVEHEISVLSAQQVMAALDEERYEILPLYIACLLYTSYFTSIIFIYLKLSYFTKL